jgi:heptosyltransferase-2
MALFGAHAPRHVAVVQPLPGIGDMIWHLPHLRAIADATPDARRILIAKPRAAAPRLLAGEGLFDGYLALDRNPDAGRGLHDGPLGFARLVTMLRRQRFDAAVLLHHSASLAAALLAARIPRRLGYGFGAQRLFLNEGPFLPAREERLHPYDQAGAWLRAAGVTPPDAEPRLTVSDGARASAAVRVGAVDLPFAVLGIGSSEPAKQWGAASFAALARLLAAQGWARIVLLGGMAEAALADAIADAAPDAPLARAIGWDLAEVAGLLAAASVFAGNDTGVLNMAAACGTRAIGLFGATPPLHHSALIEPVLPPEGGPDPRDAMARITPATVAQRVGAAADEERSGASPRLR